MAKKAAKAKKKSAGSAAGKTKGTIEVFDPFGPGFRVFHKTGGKKIHVGGAKDLAPDAATETKKVTLQIFDPFGPGFRVVRKDEG